jgi:signal transduction histidine kinase
MSSIEHAGQRASSPALTAQPLAPLDSGLQSAILDATGCLLVAAELGSGIVVAVNTLAETVSGRPREKWLGRPLWEVASSAHQAIVRSAFVPSEGAGIPRVYETTTASDAEDGIEGHRILWSSEFVSDAAGVRSHVVFTGTVVTCGKSSTGLVNHMMRAATDAVMIGTDQMGRVTFCSAGAEQMLGFSAAELMGRRLPQTIFETVQFQDRAVTLGLPADLTLLTANLFLLDRRGRPAPRLGRLGRRANDIGNRQQKPRSTNAELQKRDWTLIRKDGSRLTATIAVSSVTDRAGNHIGYVGIAHDVTEQRLTQELLMSALEKETEAVTRLRAVNQAKSDFVSTVSHELRTPVTSITGYTELLEDGLAGELTSKQLKLVAAVRRNGERLTALVDDLLALASSEGGTLLTETLDLDLRAVIARTEAMLHPLLLSRRLEMSFDLPGRPVTVRGDAKQLERVLVNLLSNAVKFTEDGGRISCSLSSQAGQAFIEVSDTGIGIPSEEQGSLFTSFFRASSAQTRAIQGSGLGLSIAAAIVDGHGGDVFVASEHLNGATFTVRLPLAEGRRLRAHVAFDRGSMAVGH